MARSLTRIRITPTCTTGTATKLDFGPFQKTGAPWRET
jgi:hypothetical protein